MRSCFLPLEYLLNIGRPLNCGDVCVLDIALADSWNGEGVATQLRKASEKAGHNPRYVISDNASIMKKRGKMCRNESSARH